MERIQRAQLNGSEIGQELVGDDHGLDVTLIFVDAPPGSGPALHSHPYDEIFIIQEGQATFVVGEERHEVRAGEIVIARAHQPHSFVNSGTTPLRQVNIHLSERFNTEWLD